MKFYATFQLNSSNSFCLVICLQFILFVCALSSATEVIIIPERYTNSALIEALLRESTNQIEEPNLYYPIRIQQRSLGKGLLMNVYNVPSTANKDDPHLKRPMNNEQNAKRSLGRGLMLDLLKNAALLKRMENGKYYGYLL